MIVKMTGVLSTGEAVAGTIAVMSLFMALILTVRDWVITSVLMVIFTSKVLSSALTPKGLVWQISWVELELYAWHLIGPIAGGPELESSISTVLLAKTFGKLVPVRVRLS